MRRETKEKLKNDTILVLSGKLKHGKDTLAGFIINSFGKKCREYNKNVNSKYKKQDRIHQTAFANPIKEMTEIMFPQIPPKDLWGPSQNRSNIVKNCINPQTGSPLTVRDVLIHLGKWGRQCNNDCWINATYSKVYRMIENNYNVIISDGRFLNELDYSKKVGAKIIRVIRPDVNYTIDDESETNLDSVPLSYYDYVLYNTSLQKLSEEADNIVNRYIVG